MSVFLIDIIAEFTNVRVAGGRYSTKLDRFIKNGDKKVFAFTNKTFAKKINNIKYDDSNLPKRFFNLDKLAKDNKTNLNPYDYAALKNNVANGWLSPAQIDKKITNSKGVNIKDIKQLERMGVIKTQMALHKLEKLSQPKSNAKVLTRTLTVPDDKLSDFLSVYEKNNQDITNDFVKKRNGKLFFNNNISTTANPNLTFGLNSRLPSSKIKFMIKPKKNSSGKYLGDNGNLFEEEVTFPKDTTYKVRHIKNNKGFYNIRLDEV